MQTKYESSSTPSQPHHSIGLSQVKSIATSQLPGGVKNASIAGAVAVIFTALIASLMASPSPTTVTEVEDSEPTAATSTEATPVVIAEPETEVTATELTDTTTDTATEAEAEVTATEPTEATTDTATEAEAEVTATEPTEATTDTATEAETEVTATEPIEATTDTTVTATVPETSITRTEATTDTATVPDPDATTTEATTDTATATPESEVTTPSPETEDAAAGSIASSVVTENSAETEANEAVTSTPETATEETLTAAATSEVNSVELSQSLYNQIDSTWSIPVDGESVYVVKLNSNGEILGYEPKSQVAKNNAENTPLPTLVKSDATSTETAAAFEVVFSTSGILEVNELTSP